MTDTTVPLQPRSAVAQLKEISQSLRSGIGVEDSTARELLGWAGVSRRGRRVVSIIRRDLRNAGLRTRPDFEYAYIDEPIVFSLEEDVTDPPSSSDTLPAPVPEVTVNAGAAADPIYRIGILESANLPPVSVGLQTSMKEAITMMLYHDFSQLPVMQGERDLRGAISWRSIGQSLALGKLCVSVSECMEAATAIASDTSLFAAIPTIAEKEYVFIVDSTRKIVGIVTTTDLSLQFRVLAEPFLLLGEIENHLRHLSDGKFTAAELASVRDPGDSGRTIEDLSDLTFGEHLRLLQNPARWQALGLSIDRGVFVKLLDGVRTIRNDVMHFDPDGVEPNELVQLRNFSRLLATLRSRSAA